MINLGSELSTHGLTKELSDLGELLGDDFTHISKNSVYEIANRIFAYKEEIEEHLWPLEKNLFNLKKHIIL